MSGIAHCRNCGELDESELFADSYGSFYCKDTAGFAVTCRGQRDEALAALASKDEEIEANWDAVIGACKQAWPEKEKLTYSQSPTELIIDIINERDEALAARDQEIARLKKQADLSEASARQMHDAWDAACHDIADLRNTHSQTLTAMRELAEKWERAWHPKTERGSLAHSFAAQLRALAGEVKS